MLHALVLSGGGAKGAYEAGAAAAVIDHYRLTRSPIRILSGTSVGALNAAAIACRGTGWTMNLWRNVSDRDVYHKARLAIPWRMWRKSSLYDSTPLRRLIERHVDLPALRASSYDVYVHATLLGTKQQVVFTNEDDDFLTGVYASASVPGAFPPVAWRGRWLVDGGTVDNSPIRTCIKAGAEMITVIHLDDEMPAEPVQATQVVERDPPARRPSLIDAINWSVESMMDAHFWRDLRNVQLINRAVEAGLGNGYRKIELHVIGPNQELGGTLDFDTKRLRREVVDGRRTALRLIRRRLRRTGPPR